jgi:leucyl aminopeptidase (aminopeptidase T)
MKYLELLKESNALVEERLALVLERLREIERSPEIGAPFSDYFKSAAAYLLEQAKIEQEAESGALATWSAEEGKRRNEAMYEPFLTKNYENSYANPAYAVRVLGKEYGEHLCTLFGCIEEHNHYAFEGMRFYVCIYAELLVEIYNLMEDETTRTREAVSSCIYSFMHDYSEVFAEQRVGRMINPDWDYNTQTLMNADLSNDAYLYRFGLYVGDNERKSRAFLSTFSDEEIQAMADTYTEGYRIGFSVCNKDITKKSVVEIRYPLGFERMVKAAVKNFRKMNLSPVIFPYSTPVNRQYEYDHREVDALWMDKAYVEYAMECRRNAFETVKDIAPRYGGPAVIEVFGEEPFSPVAKEENPRYSEKQQKLSVYRQSELSKIINHYIHGEERSFTIIAYPIPAIGKDYEAIFAETVRLNTLDYALYRDMQQKIIDILDTADNVHVVGANGNRTDLTIKIRELSDPEKETAFENCVADVNIPVGEVFTSPVLSGTNGTLHVSQVFLNELDYRNLELEFKDGMIASYTCTNFDDEADNKAYIEENVLFHHKTLPMGEFAIGTNTTAYCMARKFNIADKLPILIAEKTGPHFAVGDTCYTYDEDNITYNPDGKAIVARDNEVSALRNTDISKAYFNCHTDITIPYDELGAITVIRKDGSTRDIIRDGKFVVPGTEILNQPLEKMEGEQTWQK